MRIGTRPRRPGRASSDESRGCVRSRGSAPSHPSVYASSAAEHSGVETEHARTPAIPHCWCLRIHILLALPRITHTLTNTNAGRCHRGGARASIVRPLASSGSSSVRRHAHGWRRTAATVTTAASSKSSVAVAELERPEPRTRISRWRATPRGMDPLSGQPPATPLRVLPP